VNSSDVRIKNPWLDVEVQFNDKDFEPAHMEPNNEHCGEVWVDPSAPVHLGNDARSWDTLKNPWGEVREAVTLVPRTTSRVALWTPRTPSTCTTSAEATLGCAKST